MYSNVSCCLPMLLHKGRNHQLTKRCTRFFLICSALSFAWSRSFCKRCNSASSFFNFAAPASSAPGPCAGPLQESAIHFWVFLWNKMKLNADDLTGLVWRGVSIISINNWRTTKKAPSNDIPDLDVAAWLRLSLQLSLIIFHCTREKRSLLQAT